MIQWHEWADGAQSADGTFEVESVAGGWQATRTEGQSRATSPVFGSMEESKGWCDMFVRTPADDTVMPDVLIETVDGQTIILPATEAPRF